MEKPTKRKHGAIAPMPFDQVVKRLLNTPPPHPKTTSKKKKPGKTRNSSG